MPTYVYPPHQPSGHHRQRTYSQSYYPVASHSANPQVVYTTRSHSHSPHHHTGHLQTGTHYANPQYLTPNYHYDTGRHHTTQGHHRSGSGNVYYTSSAPTHHSSSRRSPTHHHTTTRRSTDSHRDASHSSGRHARSQSVPRQDRHTVRVVDYGSGNRLRRSESRPRETSTHNVSHQRRGSSSGEPLGERIRRMFGFGGSSHNTRDHRADYVDARTGRTVDWQGRPIYRV